MKNNIQAACYYFPTTVYFVDDEPAFLKSLTFTLHRGLSYEFYHDPRVMLKAFSRSKRPSRFLKHTISDLSDSTIEDVGLTDHPVNIDILQLHQAVYDDSRFSDVSVIVVDYAMPGMNGLQLAKLVKDVDVHVKVIMLTGQADLNLAIQAFNNHDIDQFILKDNQDFSNALNQSIASLQQQYFFEQSENIVAALSANHQSLLANHIFARFFQLFCLDHQIQEYYLADSTGSFLLVDIDGRASWLVVCSQEAVDDYYDLLNDVALSEAANFLKSKKKIPFLLTDDQLRLPATEWLPFLHPASPIPGLLGYFYAHVVEDGRYHLGEIFPYKDYLLTEVS